MTNLGNALQGEIGQSRPFRSRSQEAALSLLRTAEQVRNQLSAAIEPFGITMQQYNVLRILRGAQPGPLATNVIADRMVERTPGITRLLDRLEAKGLVCRARCTEDRRLVHCSLTAEGHELLARMDPVIDRADDAVLDRLGEDELATLIQLLARARDR